MNKAFFFVVLGMTFFVAGALYMMFDLMVTDHILSRFWVETPYMNIMSMQWNMIPTALFILALINAVFAVAASKAGRGTVIV